MKISAVESRVVKGSTGVEYIVTLGNFQKWLVYCSEPVVLSWKDDTLTSPTPIHGVIRVAILPLQNLEAAFNTLTSYVQRYPTGGIITIQHSTNSLSQVTIQFSSVGIGSLLMLALPHQIAVMATPIINATETRVAQISYFPIYCSKGKLKAVVGDVWKLSYNMPPIGWNYVLTEAISLGKLDEIGKSLMLDVKTILPNAIDIYSFGKQIARMARLAVIADTLGIGDARQQALNLLESCFGPWLQGVNTDALLYDRTYGGIVTTQGFSDPNSDFGSGYYNDHHFHYGYLIYAAATIARFDPPFFETNKNQFDSIVRDICNPDPTDTDFPFARHKDFFDGHSWASGLLPQANGKGQESSSEVR
jgi:endo-1,3(4)-beta-glucanase